MLCPKSRRALIFTLPGHSLPSQYRSLLPVTDPEVQRMMKVEKASRQIRNIALALTVLLFVIVVVIIALIVAFQVSVDEQVTPYLYADSKHTVVDKVHSLVLNTTMNVEKTGAYGLGKNGTPCQDQCWEFSAFKFKATCDKGMCRCHDPDYDSITCLPNYAGCHIKMYTPSMTSLDVSSSGQPQIIFACVNKDVKHFFDINTSQLQNSKEHTGEFRDESELSDFETATQISPDLNYPQMAYHTTKASYLPSSTAKNIENASENSNLISSSEGTTSSNQPKNLNPNDTLSVTPKTSKSTEEDKARSDQTPEVHVISVFDNHGAPSTRMVVNSDRVVKLILVLVSYEPVLWNVTTGDNVTIENIVLISNHRVSRSRLFISQAQRHDSKMASSQIDQSHGAPVARMLLRTGYGNDKMSGNTPQLLKSITQSFGPIKSFVGVASADLISYNVDFE